MNKFTLLLLACSCGLGAMLLIANPANAAEKVAQATDQILSNSATQAVSVRSIKQVSNNSLMTLNAQDRSNPLHQFGCGCSACQKPYEELQGQFPAF